MKVILIQTILLACSFANVVWEKFEGSEQDGFDLDGIQLTLLPSGSSYEVLKSKISQFSIDPAEGILLQNSGPDMIYNDLPIGGENSFPFFGALENSISIDTKGRVFFGLEESSSSELEVDHFKFRQIALLWSNSDQEGAVRMTRKGGRVGITWENLNTESGAISAQLELFYDGRIRMSYLGEGQLEALVGVSPGGEIFDEVAEQEDDLSQAPLIPLEVIIQLRDQFPVPTLDQDDLFGSSVVMSGNLIAVGAPGNDSNSAGINGNEEDNSADRAGAVYVFEKKGGSWSQQAFIKPGNPDAGDSFGTALALEGDILVVGSDREDGGRNGDGSDNSSEDSGAVYVFRKDGETWVQEAYLKASNADSRDFFGQSVALNGDTLAVGAYWEGSASVGVNGDDENNSLPKAGAVYLFERIGEAWTQTAYLKSSNTEDDRFGFSVALSENLLAVGATSEDGGSPVVNGDESDNSVSGSGAVYVFEREDSVWSQKAYLKASNLAMNDRFGFSVAISGDTIAAGANEKDVGNPSAGAVYFFDRNQNGQWFESYYLTDPQSLAFQRFGTSLDFAGEMMVSPESDVLYLRNGSDWLAQPFFLYPDHSKYENLSLVGRPSAISEGLIVSITLENISILETTVLQTHEVILIQDGSGRDLQTRRDNLNFPLTEIGRRNATKTLSITNESSYDLAYLSVEIIGDHAGDFAFDPGSLSAGLAAGETKIVQFDFSPTGLGVRDAEVRIQSNLNATNPFVVFLRGEAGGSGTEAEVLFLKSNWPSERTSFGDILAISDDTLVVGVRTESISFSETMGVPNAGVVYVYEREGDSWEMKARLRASNPDDGDIFGASVDISGNVIVVGAPRESSDLTGGETSDVLSRSGAAYVFERLPTGWTQTGFLKASNADAFDGFGHKVAVSGDLIAVTSPSEDDGASTINGDQESNAKADSGAVYLFRKQASNWVSEAYIKASNSDADDNFGLSLSLDGNHLAVGAAQEDGRSRGINGDDSDNSASASGAVYLFSNESGEWEQEAYLKSSNSDAGDGFGRSIDLRGKTLVVGAPWEDSAFTGMGGNPEDQSAEASGAVYVFCKTDLGWVEQAFLKSSNSEAGDHFGSSIALWDDLIAVGAPDEDSGYRGANTVENDNSAAGSGAVYLFERGESGWDQVSYLKSSNSDGPVFSDTYNGDQFGSELTMSGQYVLAGAPGEDSRTKDTPNDNTLWNAGAAYLFDLEILFGGNSKSISEFYDAVSSAGLSGNDGEPGAIPFMDGTPNLLKYAFNLGLSGEQPVFLSPGGTKGLPLGALEHKNGVLFYRIQYLKRRGSGLIYIPLISPSLKEDSFIPVDVLPIIEPIDLHWERATLDVPVNSAQAVSKIFFRISVEFRD